MLNEYMSDPIDSLLNQAIAYAFMKLNDPAHRSFTNFKYKYPSTDLTSYGQIANGEHDYVEMREQDDDRGKQRGLYAKCDIDAGTWLVISQPVAAYWDAEINNDERCKNEEGKNKDPSDDDINDEDVVSRDTNKEGQLILRVLEKIQSTPSIWQNNISKLYPRDVKTASALPTWECANDDTKVEVEKQMQLLHKLALFAPEDNETICNNIRIRLPLIVRYNSFRMETSPELFVYPDLEENGLESLAGVGLYGPELSYFNHSCTPNLSKFCIGDVTVMFANRDTAEGDELCHSYLSHEYLCENEETRNAILANDFCLENHDDSDEKEQRPAKRRKGDGSEQSRSVISVPPFVLGRRFDPTTGILYKPVGPGEDFKCISEYLFPIWKAKILEGKGRSNKHRGDKKLGLEHALPEWEAAIEFAEKTFPPLDARKITLYVQASLCASVNSFQDFAKLALRTKGLRVGDKAKAIQYANKALEMHHAIFGGGKVRFLKRYVEEFYTSHQWRGQMSEAQLLMNLEDLWDFGNEGWDELTASQQRGKDLIEES